jgi:hypothetical protein
MPTDRQITKVLGRFSVRGNEETIGFPSLAPPLFGEPGGFEIVVCLCETPAAATDSDALIRDSPFHFGKTVFEDLKSTLFLEPLGLAGAAAVLATSIAGWDRKEYTDATDPACKAPALGEEVAIGELPRILGRSGDRSGPARGGTGGEAALSFPTGFRT